MGRVLRGGRETGHTEYTESMSGQGGHFGGEGEHATGFNPDGGEHATGYNPEHATGFNQMEANMPRDTILTMLRVSTQMVGNMLQDTTQTMLQDAILNTPQDSILTEGIMQRDSTEETEDRVATFED